MKLLKVCLVICVAFVLRAHVYGQSAAAQRLAMRYSSEQIQDIQAHSSYKYQGLLLFYSESWLVDDQGQLRKPTEQEILAVDIDKYTPDRQSESRVAVHDGATQLNLVLLGRKEFEALYLTRISPAEKDAYLASKAAHANSQSKQAE